MQNFEFDKNFREHFPATGMSGHAQPFYITIFDCYPSSCSKSFVDANKLYKYLEDNSYQKITTSLYYYNLITQPDASRIALEMFIDKKTKTIVCLTNYSKSDVISATGENLKDLAVIDDVTISTSAEYLTKISEAINNFCCTKIQSKEISFLVQKGQEIGTITFKCPEVKIENMGLSYGKNFVQVHDKIISALNEQNKGLILLYGLPGTGKTSYLKYLLQEAPKKEKIYISSDTAHILTRPDFIQTLMNHRNSILFIEDAESVVRTREQGDINPGITNLLNLADGILGDCLNIQVICTFNTDIKNVDAALRRKGRLIAEYDFAALQPSEANELLQSLNIDYRTQKPMTLAEIYRCQEENFAQIEPKKVITGFGG